MSKHVAKLALEDGTVFTGVAFGGYGAGSGGSGTASGAASGAASGGGAESQGEVVFNTSMTGYQEILTDPSYKGQIVTMTYPLIGNCGINEEDVEAAVGGKPQVAGFVVKELPPLYSNYRATTSLHAYLERNNIPGISGIDTRALTRRLRMKGSMRGILSCVPHALDAELVARARSAAQMAGADWVKAVMPEKQYTWSQGLAEWAQTTATSAARPREGRGLHVVALDCGAKSNILRNLTERGVRVTVLPPDTSSADILRHNPDGLFISNGPGDPAVLDYAVTPIADSLGKVPIFGICLGHQLLGRALGADTYKLKFGHRGGNQPVKNLDTGRVEITSQNHGFAVDRASLEAAGGVVTHLNLNDGTVEGFRHRKFPLFCVQYHPEASPGPHDAGYLFDAFIDMMKSKRPLDPERVKALQGPH